MVSERHPLFVGLYEGAIGDQQVTEFVEKSDLVLLLGAFLSDINLGIYTAKLDPNRCVYATSEQLRISHHHYHNVDLREFLAGLNQAGVVTAKREIPEGLKQHRGQTRMSPSWKVSTRYEPVGWCGILNQLIDADTIVIADVGDSLFAATELTIHDRGEFLSPAYYTSMGFSIPAALGAATARPDHRIVVLGGRRRLSNDWAGTQHATGSRSPSDRDRLGQPWLRDRTIPAPWRLEVQRDSTPGTTVS